MRWIIAPACALPLAVSLCAAPARAQSALTAHTPPPGAYHTITEAQVKAMAYAGCTEAGSDPVIRNEEYVQFSVYNRGLRDRREWGRSNLVEIVNYRGQYNGVERRRPCGAAQWRRSMGIARLIVSGDFIPEPGWLEVTNFLAPCYSTPGGKASFRGLVYLGTRGGHDFYREPKRGERPHFLDCGQSPTYAAYLRAQHKKHHRNAFVAAR